MSGQSAEIRYTVCNRDCPDACRIMATINDGRVTQLQGDPNHPITRGSLCYRTNHFLDRQYATDRLTRPLLRRNGELVPVGWDEALNVAAERLERIKAESGPAAIFHYRSGGSLGLLKSVTDYFFDQFGPVTTKHGDICSGASEAAQECDFGVSDSNDIFDLLNARHIVLWGKNVATSSPHTLRVLKDAPGSKLLIDPVYHQSARLCDTVIQPKPGGDFALAMAVARVLFERNWVDPDCGEYCDNLQQFKGLVFSCTLGQWCRSADVAEHHAVEIARRLNDGPTAILVGWGMGRRVNGAAITRALDALGAISGNLGIPGGGVSFYFRRRGAFNTSWVGGRANAPRTICEPLLGPEVLAAKEPPIRALWVTAGNPVVMLPESNTVEEAIRTREFVVVVDSFMTDTAKLADLVLPTTTLLEDDDLLGAYGHHYLGVSQPVVSPPLEVRSDLEIIQGIASRVGLGEKLKGSHDDWKDRFISDGLREEQVTVESLNSGPIPNPLVPKILFEGRQFPTATGRVNLIDSMPVEPDPDDLDFPLVLMSLSTPKSQSSQWAKPQSDYAELTVHPNAAPGIEDGALTRLESRIGHITVRICYDDKQREDVAVIPKGGHKSAGRCANDLIAARTTDMGDGGALYDARVRLLPIEDDGN